VSDFRRYFVPGGTYFFTLVTANRAPLFSAAQARATLGTVMRDECHRSPFVTVAIVLLPDHLHAIWTLPDGDDAYSRRWQAIKARFAMAWLGSAGQEQQVSPGYGRQRRRGVWQPRFMEHTIRDETDLHSHADYIHYNPVKHGYATRPLDWPWSTFRRYVRSGDYPEGWGAAAAPQLGLIDQGILE
jgi:putative transposase